MKEEIKIICTIGPASKNERTLRCLEARNVFLVRLNLSHIESDEIEKYILLLKKFNISIAVDTEGAQVRTGRIAQGSMGLHIKDSVKIHNANIKCDTKNIYFTPLNIIDCLVPGDLIAMDFNSVLLKVTDVSERHKKNYVTCAVIVDGMVGSNKGVHCDRITGKLHPFTRKDLRAVELAKKHGIRYFTLSFMNNEEEVKLFKRMCPEAVIYAKIETIAGLKNVSSILNHVHGILIDRGDLSREIPIEKIPLIQKVLINTAREHGKEVFVASNLLETMASDLKPTRAEVNDVVNTILDGVSGFVLTKETAVGKYPVETINILKNLIEEGKSALKHSIKPENFRTRTIDLSWLKDANGATGHIKKDFLITPHGGKLVDRYDGNGDYLGLQEKAKRLKKLYVDEEVLMDAEHIAVGAFSPLDGFLCKTDYRDVLNEMRLSNGVTWPIPVVLPAHREQTKNLKIGEKVALVSKNDNRIYGIIQCENIYPYNKEEFAKKVYGTTSSKHPGVRSLKQNGEFLIGGRITLLRRMSRMFSHYDLTPKQTRYIFEALGWSLVVGFHTKNPVHRAHEYIQLKVMEDYGCDGLFVHPIIGKRREGDFVPEVIIRSYEVMLKHYYPKNKVLFALFPTYPRYAGPREALFTALYHKNFGCSHFIVGKNPINDEDFSHAALRRIFSQFDDLGITPVFFDEVYFSKKSGSYITKNEAGDGKLYPISGTEFRKMLERKLSLPDWFMRPEVAKILIEQLKTGKDIFVQ